jgi:hypothetical protein
MGDMCDSSPFDVISLQAVTAGPANVVPSSTTWWR